MSIFTRLWNMECNVFKKNVCMYVYCKTLTNKSILTNEVSTNLWRDANFIG